MVRNNFLFLKNVKQSYIIEHQPEQICDIFYNNFIFFKNVKNIDFFNKKVIKVKKINSSENCINLLYF